MGCNLWAWTIKAVAVVGIPTLKTLFAPYPWERKVNLSEYIGIA